MGCICLSPPQFPEKTPAPLKLGSCWPPGHPRDRGCSHPWEHWASGLGHPTASNTESESQNHRMVGVGRDLCGSSSPTPLLQSSLLPPQRPSPQLSPSPPSTQQKIQKNPEVTPSFSPFLKPNRNVSPAPAALLPHRALLRGSWKGWEINPSTHTQALIPPLPRCQRTESHHAHGVGCRVGQ